MDIFEHRRQRLQQLIKSYYAENQRRFSEETRIKAPQINRWLSTTASEKRRITETSARKIERASGKVPVMWLDRTDDDELQSFGPALAFPAVSEPTQQHARPLVQTVCELAEQINDNGLRELIGFARCLTGTHPAAKQTPASSA